MISTTASTFSLAFVLQAERPAWASDERGQYHFDGIYLWRLTDRGKYACLPSDGPQHGWRHRDSCRCPACAGRQ